MIFNTNLGLVRLLQRNAKVCDRLRELRVNFNSLVIQNSSVLIQKSPFAMIVNEKVIISIHKSSL